jgi:hypothetical protein
MKTSQIDINKSHHIEQILFNISWAASCGSNLISHYDLYSGVILTSRSYRLYDLFKRPSRVLPVHSYVVLPLLNPNETLFRLVSSRGLVSSLVITTKVVLSKAGTSLELQVVKLSDLTRESEQAFTKPGN